MAAPIPWREIITALPTMVSGARAVWKHWQARPQPDASGLQERLAALEGLQGEQAKVVAELATQLEAVARRTAVAYWMGLGGVVLGLAALAVAILR